MKRREFVQKSAAGAGALAMGSGLASAAETRPKPGKEAFNLKYAPHLGMFKHHAGEDPVDQIQFMADQGFRAFEDNSLTQREVGVQEKIGAALARNNMQMGVFVGNWNARRGDGLARGEAAMRKQFLDEMRASVEVARRVDATWMTIVLGERHPKLELDYQTAHIVETLRRACDILEPHGLVMVLEPLNPWVNHPNMFLAKIPHAYLICKAVNSPSCKILFDMYHQQITEGNIINNIDLAWDEIGYFQIGDVPGRKEPTTGEMNYKNIFRHIYNKGYTGVLGMEHGNFHPGKEGEVALIKAYREVDAFR
ncbi:MAG: twin-arginine translocation signal domain-containing protein [Bacteroidetes bacterium]|nr:MAG: twin-arginine translocation signal domain-containing protein [Bacteroidota bacterium]